MLDQAFVGAFLNMLGRTFCWSIFWILSSMCSFWALAGPFSKHAQAHKLCIENLPVHFTEHFTGLFFWICSTEHLSKHFLGMLDQTFVAAIFENAPPAYDYLNVCWNKFCTCLSKYSHWKFDSEFYSAFVEHFLDLLDRTSVGAFC